METFLSNDETGFGRTRKMLLAAAAVAFIRVHYATHSINNQILSFNTISEPVRFFFSARVCVKFHRQKRQRHIIFVTDILFIAVIWPLARL